MKDWAEYSKSKTTGGSTENSKPSIREYMLIKLTDNFLAVAVFVLCVIFAAIGIFGKQDNNTAWTLHAAELCLGVFLGLLKKTNK
jgi:hypothetical protein